MVQVYLLAATYDIEIVSMRYIEMTDNKQDEQGYLSLIYKYVFEVFNDKNEQFYICSNENIKDIVQTDERKQDILLENGGYVEVNKLDIYNSKIELTESYNYGHKTCISSLFDPLDIKHTLLLQIGDGNDEIVLTDAIGHVYDVRGLVPKIQSFDFTYLLPGRTDLLLYQMDGIDIPPESDDEDEDSDIVQANYVIQLFKDTNSYKIIYNNIPNPKLGIPETYPREFTGRHAVYLIKNKETGQTELHSEAVDCDIHTIAFTTYNKNDVVMYLQYSNKTGKLYTSGSGIKLKDLVMASKPYLYNIDSDKIAQGNSDDIHKTDFNKSGYIDIDRAMYKFNSGEIMLVRRSFYGVTSTMSRLGENPQNTPTELLNNDGEMLYIDSDEIDHKIASSRGLNFEIGRKVQWIVQQIQMGDSLRYHDIYITKFGQAVIIYKYIYKDSKYIAGDKVVDTIKIIFLSPTVNMLRNQQIYMSRTGGNIYLKQEDYAQNQQFKQLVNTATRKLTSNRLYQIMATGEVRLLGDIVKRSGGTASDAQNTFELNNGLTISDVYEITTPRIRTYKPVATSDRLVKKSLEYKMSADIGIRTTWF